MAAPTTAITRLDLSMSRTEFDVEANREGFVGLKVMPVVGVQMPALANFPIIHPEALLTPVEDTERGPDGNYKRQDFKWDKGSYSTSENGVEEELDDHEVQAWGQMVQIEVQKARRGVNRLLQALESKIAAKLFNTTTFAGKTSGPTGGHGWKAFSTAKPIDDIMSAAETVQNNCGRMANAVVIPRLTLRAWSQCSQVTDRYKALFGNDSAFGQQGGVRTSAMAEAFRQLYDLDYVFVADGMKNTAGFGQSVTYDRFWNPDYCLVFHHNPSADLMRDPRPCLGKTIMWQQEIASLPGEDDGAGAIIVEEYREESRRGSVMRFRFNYDVFFQRAECGYLLTGLTGNT